MSASVGTRHALTSAKALTVWDAFVDLHTYFCRVADESPTSVHGVALPARISRRPRRADRAAAESVATTLATIRNAKGTPPVDDRRLAWLYLWAQVWRVSHRLGMTQVRTGEWRNIAWYPLHVLRGRSEDVALAAWRRWLYQNDFYKNWEDDVARSMYPRPQSGYSDEVARVRAHLRSLRRGMSDNDTTDDDVFATCDPLGGRPRHRGVPVAPWHVWLRMARPSTWASELTPEIEDEVAAMLDDKDAWRAWVRLVPELVADVGITVDEAVAPVLILADHLALAEPPSRQRAWRQVRPWVVDLVRSGSSRSPRRKTKSPRARMRA